MIRWLVVGAGLAVWFAACLVIGARTAPWSAVGKRRAIAAVTAVGFAIYGMWVWMLAPMLPAR